MYLYYTFLFYEYLSSHPGTYMKLLHIIKYILSLRNRVSLLCIRLYNRTPK